MSPWDMEPIPEEGQYYFEIWRSVTEDKRRRKKSNIIVPNKSEILHIMAFLLKRNTFDLIHLTAG